MTGVLVLVGLAALGGGTAQAVTGFGFALAAVPLVGLAVHPRVAVAVVTATSLALTIGATLKERHHVDNALTARLTAPAIVGMPIGLLLLLEVPSRALSVLIAVTAVGFVGLSRLHWQPAGHPYQVLMGGLVSGTALTSTGMNGPPVVSVIHALQMSPAQQRATLQAVFTLQDVFAVGGFVATGQLAGGLWILVAAAVPCSWAGWLLGNALFNRLDQHTSRRMVLATLVASASVLVIKACT